MMNLRNGKHLTIRDEELNKKKKKRAKLAEIEDQFNTRPYLPDELILESILIRLSARDLAKWSCVSKSWYDLVRNDSRFASSHFVHNKNKLNLVFNLLNVLIHDREIGYVLSIEEDKDKNDDGFPLHYRLLMDITCKSTQELVGFCNGLACVKQVGKVSADRGKIGIVNPTRSETLSLSYAKPTTTGEGGGFCRHLCHGFCFDTLLQKYKVVFIYTTTSPITGDQEFVCMVLTLGEGGTNPWRKIVTSTAQISAPPGSTSAFPVGMVTRSSRTTRRSATVCGGDLLWRITNHISKDNKVDMLLSFNIHDEKIQFVCLPTECNLTRTTTATRNAHQCLVVDHHLVEYKGKICVARTEKTMMCIHSNHHLCDHRRHRRNGRRCRFCCCGFKVHLFILKDKVKQVWIKGETFDLQIKEEGLFPAPFCCYFDSTAAAAATTTTMPTRILSFSDQLLLYWLDGEYLLLYNLQMKHLKVVKSSTSCEKRSLDIFETKMKNGIHPGRCIGDDDNFDFPYMDYQLHAQAENILTLKTFIPDGETKKFYSYRDLEKYTRSGEKEKPAGLVNTQRELVKLHAFY